MADEKRPYRKKRRAELEAQTQLRITESAVALHGTLGPSRTSMSAIAEHAGVRRSTLYRHFPDETAVFAACSAHWREANPAPDLGAWAAIEDPDRRVRSALEELYAYYRRTEGMMVNLYRDAELMPTVARSFSRFADYLATGHAIAIATWRSLVREQGMDDPAAAELMCRFVAAAG
jgi:AcrR family transcriptional regulator